MLFSKITEEFRVKGWVRIPGAFSKDAANIIEDKIWYELKSLYDFQRKDSSTWKVDIPLKLQRLKILNSINQ